MGSGSLKNLRCISMCFCWSSSDTPCPMTCMKPTTSHAYLNFSTTAASSSLKSMMGISSKERGSTILAFNSSGKSTGSLASTAVIADTGTGPLTKTHSSRSADCTMPSPWALAVSMTKKASGGRSRPTVSVLSLYVEALLCSSSPVNGSESSRPRVAVSPCKLTVYTWFSAPCNSSLKGCLKMELGFFAGRMPSRMIPCTFSQYVAWMRYCGRWLPFMTFACMMGSSFDWNSTFPLVATRWSTTFWKNHGLITPSRPFVFQVPPSLSYRNSMFSLRAFSSSMKIRISGGACRPGTRPSARTSSIMKISLFAAFRPCSMMDLKFLILVPWTKAPLLRYRGGAVKAENFPPVIPDFRESLIVEFTTELMRDPTCEEAPSALSLSPSCWSSMLGPSRIGWRLGLFNAIAISRSGLHCKSPEPESGQNTTPRPVHSS
mmetsp:Transcript_62381/g.172847  ORF Transcript_62381/g.172847 Transcript_62381/m.172847 type:complete len:433 (+) Transcript_62381:688-1986(+)